MPLREGNASAFGIPSDGVAQGFGQGAEGCVGGAVPQQCGESARGIAHEDQRVGVQGGFEGVPEGGGIQHSCRAVFSADVIVATDV